MHKVSTARLYRSEWRSLVRVMASDFNPFKAPPSSRKAALIVAAARAIVAERGAEAVTRKSVAERAGVAPAEISREFPDRAALMQAVASSDDQ